MAEVTEIGSCAGCGRRSVLEQWACAACRARWGQRCGPIMQRIRTDPEFARKCHDALEGQDRRKLFTDMFGKPWEPCTQS